MKNWLIKKLSGIPKTHHDYCLDLCQAVVDNLAEERDAALNDLEKERQSRREAQESLERLREWRNRVGIELRKSKIPRHIVNKIMEMKK